MPFQEAAPFVKPWHIHVPSLRGRWHFPSCHSWLIHADGRRTWELHGHPGSLEERASYTSTQTCRPEPVRSGWKEGVKHFSPDTLYLELQTEHPHSSQQFRGQMKNTEQEDGASHFPETLALEARQHPAPTPCNPHQCPSAPLLSGAAEIFRHWGLLRTPRKQTLKGQAASS